MRSPSDKWLQALRVGLGSLKKQLSQPSSRRIDELRHALLDIDIKGLDVLASKHAESAGAHSEARTELGVMLVDLTDAAVKARAAPDGHFATTMLLPALRRHSRLLTQRRAAFIVRKLAGMGRPIRTGSSSSSIPAAEVMHSLVRLVGFDDPKAINHVFGALVESKGMEEHAVAFISQPQARWPAHRKDSLDVSGAASHVGEAAFDAVRVLRGVARLSVYQHRTAGQEPSVVADVRLLTFTRQLIQYILAALPRLRGSHKVSVVRACEVLLNAGPYQVVEGTDAPEASVKLLLHEALSSFLAPLDNAPTATRGAVDVLQRLDTSFSHLCRLMCSVQRCAKYRTDGPADPPLERLVELVVSLAGQCSRDVTHVAAGDLLNTLATLRGTALGDGTLCCAVIPLAPQLIDTVPASDLHALAHMLGCLTPFTSSFTPKLASAVVEVVTAKLQLQDAPMLSDIAPIVAFLGRLATRTPINIDVFHWATMSLRASWPAVSVDQTNADSVVHNLLAIMRCAVREPVLLAQVASSLLCVTEAGLVLSVQRIVTILSLCNEARAGLLTAAVLGADASPTRKLTLGTHIFPAEDNVMSLALRCVLIACREIDVGGCPLDVLRDVVRATSTAMLTLCFAGLRQPSEAVVRGPIAAAAALIIRGPGERLADLCIEFVKAVCVLEHATYMVRSVVDDPEPGSLVAQWTGLHEDCTAVDMVGPIIGSMMPPQEAAQVRAAFSQCITSLGGAKLHQKVTTALPFVITASGGRACMRVAHVALEGLLRSGG